LPSSQTKVAFVDIDESASAEVRARLDAMGAASSFERCDIRDVAALRHTKRARALRAD
jgi:hypothetical protein